MTLSKQVFERIKTCPGITASTLADELSPDNTRYGRYKAISWVVANLRAEGKIKDCERCPTCHQATTRRERNVGLFLSE